jgi:hypothetical protein
MKIQNPEELAIIQAKLRRFEASYEALRIDDREDPRLRELSMASLMEMIQQFKNEIEAYQARHALGRKGLEG